MTHRVSYYALVGGTAKILHKLSIILLGCFFTPSGIRSASDRTLETDVLPPKME